MDDNYKWIRPDMSLTYIGKGSEHIITVANSGNLADDFYTCATGFFEAAECVIHYLGEEAAENRDISKLDIWYFAMIYLYRQCLELLLKAALFRAVNDSNDRKTIIREIRHDLKQGLKILLAKMGLTYVESENMNWLYKFFLIFLGLIKNQTCLGTLLEATCKPCSKIKLAFRWLPRMTI